MEPRVFRALSDFFSEETRSQYVKGLTYTVRSDKLADLAEGWEGEGKIEFLPRDKARGMAKAKGTGVVS